MTFSVFIIGTTGFVGAPFIHQLLKQSSTDFSLTGLVRSSSNSLFKDPRLTLVEGDYTTKEGLALITSHSAKADLVIDAADSSVTPPTQAAIEGLNKRFEETGKRGSLIHVSGTGNWLTPAPGGKVDKKTLEVAKDSDEKTIAAISVEAKNGASDQLVLKAGSSGKINTYVVCAAGIYGGTPNDGNNNRLGIFLGPYIQNAVQLKYTPYLGPGENEFHLIHVSDVVSLMLAVFDKALSTVNKEAEGTVYSRYYIATSGAYSWKRIADAVAPVLHKKGLVGEAKGRSVADADAGFMAGFLGINMSVAGSNARKEYGWEPKAKTLEEALPEILTAYAA